MTTKGFSPKDSRTVPNTGVVQPDGSTHYVGQTSSNISIPGTDSRVATSVDSSVPPTNSRVNPNP